MNNAEGAATTGDDRFGVAIRKGTLPPHWRTIILTKLLPRILVRYDRATVREVCQ